LPSGIKAIDSSIEKTLVTPQILSAFSTIKEVLFCLKTLMVQSRSIIVPKRAGERAKTRGKSKLFNNKRAEITTLTDLVPEGEWVLWIL